VHPSLGNQIDTPICEPDPADPVVPGVAGVARLVNSLRPVRSRYPIAGLPQRVSPRVGFNDALIEEPLGDAFSQEHRLGGCGIQVYNLGVIFAHVVSQLIPESVET
jgi:hypothetical protein